MAKEKVIDSRNVVIMHLDLGIGGAEQLIVNMARMLKETGHNVQLLTTHHNKNHCFEDTKPNGFLGKEVVVYGDWLPRQIGGKMTALCAVIRMLYLAFIVAFFYSSMCDVVILDGVSAPIPILRWFNLKVLFYCHFPDLLLCTDRKSSLKRLYRTLMDRFEEYTTKQSNLILVNSEFTANVFNETFPSISKKRTPKVLYPVIKDANPVTVVDTSTIKYCEEYDHVFVSLNRFERKKKIEVALGAMKVFKDKCPNVSSVLIVAGGYDSVVSENVEYLKELQSFCDQLNLAHLYLPQSNSNLPNGKYDVIFRTSISSSERTALFNTSKALLYTPDREHFGIVPLEAMQVGLPVIAVNSGGPTETIAHEKTGYLCNQDPNDFGLAMVKLISDIENYNVMKEAAMQRVKVHFSEGAMKLQLNQFIRDVSQS